WLSLTLGMTTLFFLPYVLNRILVRGLWATMKNPSVNDLPLSPWAERAKNAHANAIENLVLFAPAVLTVHILNLGNAATVIACELYFVSRSVHYVVYAAGIPVLRTLAFFGGWIGIVMLIYRLLEAAFV
ncbi:MAG: MAPEG family protein, partial [Steroidobacter sp.]